MKSGAQFYKYATPYGVSNGRLRLVRGQIGPWACPKVLPRANVLRLVAVTQPRSADQ